MYAAYRLHGALDRVRVITAHTVEKLHGHFVKNASISARATEKILFAEKGKTMMKLLIDLPDTTSLIFINYAYYDNATLMMGVKQMATEDIDKARLTDEELEKLRNDNNN